jgi:uncharacterized protein with HEPN domain
MKKDDSVYLENMLMYIVKLENYIRVKSYDEFITDEAVQNNIIRYLEVIGEASIKTSKELKDKYPEVMWAKIRGMRNVLVHDYGNIQLKVVWNTAVDGIPPLKKQIWNIISEVNPQILINYEL